MTQIGNDPKNKRTFLTASPLIQSIESNSRRSWRLSRAPAPSAFFGDGKEAYAWKGSRRSMFVESADQLVYAGNGESCTLISVDLKTGQEIWRNQIRSCPVVGSAMMGNGGVEMYLRQGCIFAFRDSGAGKFLQIFDFKSGESLAEKVFP